MNVLIQLTEEMVRMIHKAIHSEAISIEFESQTFPIRGGGRALRFVEIGGIKFIEQNPNTGSIYANRAKLGARITWGVKHGEWVFVQNDELIRIPENTFIVLSKS